MYSSSYYGSSSYGYGFNPLDMLIGMFGYVVGTIIQIALLVVIILLVARAFSKRKGKKDPSADPWGDAPADGSNADSSDDPWA